MSTRTNGIMSSVRAYTVWQELSSTAHLGFATVTIELAETREGDLPIPRFGPGYMTEEKQAKRPFVIGGPNLVMDCEILEPSGVVVTDTNGVVVTDNGRRLAILYYLGDTDGDKTKEWQSNVLFQAQGRIVGKLDSMISTLDETYKRDQHFAFVLTKR